MNTAVGVKEMVHRVFKGMVPHMNRKNVELDLIRRFNTNQALRHLGDGGIDPRFHDAQMVPALGPVLKGWYATGVEVLAQHADAVGDAVGVGVLRKNLHSCGVPPF